MHEVHVPEHSVATWKGFLLHMGTITLGLLLAIGLEQIVEAVHRHREAVSLRKELQDECERERANLHQKLNYYQRERPVSEAYRAAVRQGTKFEQLDGRLVDTTHIPNDPIWRAAVADQSSNTLSREEVRIFDELHLIYEASREADGKPDQGSDAPDAPPLENSVIDFSAMDTAKRERLDIYVRNLLRYRAAEYRLNVELLRASDAYLDGARTLDKIEEAETGETKQWPGQIKAPAPLR